MGRSAVRGLINARKQTGITSRAVVDRIVRLAPKTKVGHAGTLDPLAQGVLVVCLGAATRLVEYVQEMPKTYRAVVRLGARSATDDADGMIEETAAPRVPAEEEIRAVLSTQLGVILQRPPEYSALRIQGARAYDLARAGREISLEPRPVRIDRIEMLSYSWPLVALEVDCGAGTYIRAIARDLGDTLGCGGLITELTRTRIGNFLIEDAVDPLALTSDTLHAALRPLIDAVTELPRVQLDAGQVSEIARGKGLAAAGLGYGPEPVPAREFALVGETGQLIAVGRGDPQRNTIQPVKYLG